MAQATNSGGSWILNYNISTGILSGAIGQSQFHLNGSSGGARGSTETGRAEHSLASYDPRKPTLSHESGERGGALPPGTWFVHPPQWTTNGHPTLGKWVAYLEPISDQKTRFPRRTYDKTTGFFIHGPGARGSDGCIVIPLTQRKPLLLAIQKNGGVLLKVALSDRVFTGKQVEQFVLNRANEA